MGMFARTVSGDGPTVLCSSNRFGDYLWHQFGINRTGGRTSAHLEIARRVGSRAVATAYDAISLEHSFIVLTSGPTFRGLKIGVNERPCEYIRNDSENHERNADDHQRATVSVCHTKRLVDGAPL